METMNTIQHPSPRTDLAVTQVLAQLLERLDHSAVPVGAEQYRSVVEHLVHAFGDVEPGADLGRLLDAYPAAAEVYENLNYQHAGLCRSSLDVSLAAEVSARDAIARAMRVVKSNPVNPGETNGQG
jgi:hemoglobin-like flavoprotein